MLKILFDILHANKISIKDRPLYEKAKFFVVRDQKAQVSHIQRKLGIGYNKACCFLKNMERDGIVSTADKNNVRQILVPAAKKELKHGRNI